MKHYKEHIYSLEDRHESDISPSWQFLQVLFFMCCVVFGYTVCFTFGLSLTTMQQNCVLYSNLSFAPNYTDREGRPNNIKAVNSEFRTIYCDLVIYIPMVVSTFACFFAVMFVYCGRGGAGNQSVQESWRIIMPTILFNLVSLSLTAYAANLFQSGLKQFLRSVAAAWRTPVIALEDIFDLRLDGVNVGYDLIRYTFLTKHVTWLNVSSWALNFLWILLRLLFNVDFQLVRTTIHVYPKQHKVNLTHRKILPSVSESSTSSSAVSSTDVTQESRVPSVRFRTVQFTPSTVGPNESSPGRLSSKAVDGFQETVIAEVDYNENSV